MDTVIHEIGIATGTWRTTYAEAWIDADTGCRFFIDSSFDLKYSKTTDGGQTWGSPVNIATGSAMSLGIWFDRWTRGDDGKLIHICFTDSSNADTFYTSINAEDDSQSALILVLNGPFAVANSAVFSSITKARGGNLYIGSSVLTLAGAFARSTDGGETWGSRTTPWEATNDYYILWPGEEDDAQDVVGIYLDVDATALTRKCYDDSANTWSESGTIMSVAESGADGERQWPFGVSQRHSDGALVISARSSSGNGDLRVFAASPTAGGAITELTVIATGVANNYYPQPFIDQITDDIYVFYIGKKDGTEEGGLKGVYFVKSTDGGTTWGDEQAYSDSVLDYRNLTLPPMGKRLHGSWRKVSGEVIHGNYDHSLDLNPTVSLVAAGGYITVGPGVAGRVAVNPGITGRITIGF